MFLVAAAVCAAVAAALWVQPIAVQRVRSLEVSSSSPTPSLRERIADAIEVIPGAHLLRREQDRAHKRAASLHILGAFGAELAAGHPPHIALSRALYPENNWPRTAAACSWGGDIAQALEYDGAEHPAALRLAACWRVTERTGAPLVQVVQRLATAEREMDEARVNMHSALAGPRATARTLALLPVIGVGLGFVMGVNPLSWFLSTAWGLMVLAMGIALVGLGVWWTNRIVARAAAGIDA
ncbi:MAG: hypothetical protein RJB01_1391 [Actinomycetota bacterium]